MKYIRSMVTAAALLLLLSAFAAAQNAEVVYLEGYPELKEASGGRFDLNFGDSLRTGDSVITGQRDYVELENGPGSSIKINANTVFTVREVESGGQKETVLSTAVGSVSYKFNRFTGREPRVGSTSTVAGIRGTELSVYAGPDGSTLFLVNSGLVDVESQGQTVSLSEGDAVEVAPGQPPGEKFKWPGRQLDFSTWSTQKLDAFLKDPATGVERIKERMQFFESKINELWPQYEEQRAKLDAAREEMNSIRDSQGMEAAKKYADEHVTPLIEPTALIVLNTRYYALSALSMRRFVLGKMYMNLKSRYILNPGEPAYQNFLSLYREILDSYEETVVPQLVEADI